MKLLLLCIKKELIEEFKENLEMHIKQTGEEFLKILL